jgi:SAM-dependent methyltransferase
MTVRCRICGNPAEVFHVFPRRALFNKPLAQPEPDATADFAVAYCAPCRHMSASYDSPLAADVNDRIYLELYVHHPPTGLSPSQQRWTEFAADRVAGMLEPGARVLEVGCHDGFFHSLLRERGARVQGNEPSPFGEIARERYGIDVDRGYFDPARFEPASFDLVVARHVVEHVPEATPFVEGLASLVRPGGLLYVEVPNSLASLEERFYPEFHVDHLSYFTPGSLDALLRRAGVTPLHVESAVAYMRFPFLGSLSRRAPSTAEPTLWLQDFKLRELLDRVAPDFERYVTRLREVSAAGRIGVWGTGSIGTQYAIDGRFAADAAWYVDPNPSTRGLRLSVTGHEVHDPASLDTQDVHAIVVASGWEDDARTQLAGTTRVKRPVISFSDLVA